MEWVYLVLILIFIVWSAQMVLSYKRQAGVLLAQVELAQVNQEDVVQQAENYEAQAEQKKAELKELEHKVGEHAAKEKDLQGQIIGLKEREAARRPTRYKVENSDEPSGDA